MRYGMEAYPTLSVHSTFGEGGVNYAKHGSHR